MESGRCLYWEQQLKIHVVGGYLMEELKMLMADLKEDELLQKIKELLVVQSSFMDWLNISYIWADLNKKVFFCLIKNGYPPQHNDEVFNQVMEQVENFKHSKH